MHHASPYRVALPRKDKMIRIIIELVPDGIEALKMTGDKVVIASRFPLNDDSQDLYLFSDNQKRYAEITGYNINKNLYHPPDGNPKYLELAYQAIGELLTQNTYRIGGEFFPGLVAIQPWEFDEKIEGLLAENKAHIQSIRLFGRRAGETVNTQNFSTALAVYSREKAGDDRLVLDGEFLLNEWPDYIPYYLAIKLDPRLYKPAAVPEIDGKKYSSWGELYELRITADTCVRIFPNIPDTYCHNGLLVYFLRPDGSIANPTVDANITKRGGATIKFGSKTQNHTLAELKAEIKAGNLIYSKREGLQKYPGKKGG